MFLKPPVTPVFHRLDVNTESLNHRFQCSSRDPLQGLNHLYIPMGMERKGWIQTCHIRESALIAEDKRSIIETNILKATVSVGLLLKPSCVQSIRRKHFLFYIQQMGRREIIWNRSWLYIPRKLSWWGLSFHCGFTYPYNLLPQNISLIFFLSADFLFPFSSSPQL